jgi:hypothetical protein
MKRIILPLISAVLLAIPVLAQDFERPRNGAKIEVTENRITLKQNAKSTIEVWLVKSVKDANRSFGELSLSGTRDIDYNFEQVEVTDQYEKYNLILSTEKSVGLFTLILKGEGKNGYKVRSSILMVEVSGNTEVAAN